MNNTPTAPQVPFAVWKNLFNATFEFYQLEPWNILSEKEIFGVFDPATRRMGYVCIVGTLGEIMGMFVYRGAEGLEQYRSILKARGRRAEEFMHFQDCLCVQLARNNEMEPEDRDALSGIGATGNALWPQFRSYIPLHVPWFITEPEARYMTSVLRCSIVVIKKVIEGTFDLRKFKDKFLACYPEESTDKSLHFQTVLEKYPQKTPAPAEPLLIDENAVANVKATLIPHGIFEADVAIFPGTIMDRERPYFVRMALAADSDSGFVFNPKMIKPEENAYQALSDAIISSIAEHNILPEEIRVRDNAAAAALQPLAKMLDVNITTTKTLPAIRRFIRASGKFLAKQRK